MRTGNLIYYWWVKAVICFFESLFREYKKSNIHNGGRNMKKWTRFFYQPGLPLGEEGRRATGSG